MGKENSTYVNPLFAPPTLHYSCKSSGESSTFVHAWAAEILLHVWICRKPYSGSLVIWKASSYPQHCWMSYNSKLKHASSSGAEDSITCVCPLLHISSHLLEHQSTNCIEAPSPASPTRRATAPWRVIVIWTVGPEWAGGWGGLEGLCPGTELLLLLTVQRKDRCSEIKYQKLKLQHKLNLYLLPSLCFHGTAWHGHSTL